MDAEVLFVVQNEAHAQNFVPLARALVGAGVAEDRIALLHLDRVTGLHTLSEGVPEYSHPLECAAKTPLYRMSHAYRLAWMLRHNRDLLRAARGVKLLISGNDGAIQRRMAAAVHRAGGHHVLLLDGLLLPWPAGMFKRLPLLGKATLARCAERAGLDHLVPSIVGHSRLERIYVMHDNVRKVLRAQGVRTDIEVIVMPRLQPLFDAFCALEAPRGIGCRILYATSAFLWHGLGAAATWQERDIADLLSFARQRPDLELRIRVHPREPGGHYARHALPANVALEAGRSVAQDLRWASVLVTTRSTLAYEASLVGLPVAIYTANFPPPERDLLLGADSYFCQVATLDNVVDLAKAGQSAPPPPPRSDLQRIATELRHLV